MRVLDLFDNSTSVIAFPGDTTITARQLTNDGRRLAPQPRARGLGRGERRRAVAELLGLPSRCLCGTFGMSSLTAALAGNCRVLTTDYFEPSVTGPSLFDAELTDRAFEGELFRTGDAASTDGDTTFTYLSRLGDAIRSLGFEPMPTNFSTTPSTMRRPRHDNATRSVSGEPDHRRRLRRSRGRTGLR